MYNDKHTISIKEAAALIGIGQSTAYTAAKNGTFPVPVIRVGSRYVVPAEPLKTLLGISTTEAS